MQLEIKNSHICDKLLNTLFLLFKVKHNEVKFFLISIFCIVICYTSIAQDQQENSDVSKAKSLEEVIITATNQSENFLQAPVSIERLDLQTIKQSAQPSFFDAIQNLKGVQVITPSLGFKVINARGFANTTNVRFVQMVDGMDNQAPHIGAPIANSLGPNELDIFRVEIVPGSASAIYGMNAINGIANFITKDPFKFQGISVNQKSGFNNFNTTTTSPTYYNETNLRFAKVLHSKLAIKINGAFMKGTDWYADNRMDLNPSANISTGLIGTHNPGSDLVNQYGDEQSNRKTLTLGDKQYVVSRTGYAEKDVANYDLQNIKGDASIFYRPNEHTEMSYVYRIAIKTIFINEPIVLDLTIILLSNMVWHLSLRVYNLKLI